MAGKNAELRKKENILRDVETQRKSSDVNTIYSWEKVQEEK
jgi:hypothetical protein